MDSEDKLSRLCFRHSKPSSAQSTPERHSDDASQSPELVQEIVKSSTKKGFFRGGIDKGKKQASSSKSRMTEQPLKACKKNAINQDPKKPPSSFRDRASSRKSTRKGKNPSRISPMDQSLEIGNAKAWVCKNTACKAKLSMDDVFCKRCSCCICHKFDDNKDPSLWLVCSSESKSEAIVACLVTLNVHLRVRKLELLIASNCCSLMGAIAVLYVVKCPA